jgi:hypothetical protein
MADNAEVIVETEPIVETEAPELEIQVGADPPAEKPPVVTMTTAEFAALKAQGDSALAISKGIADLGNKLGAPQAAVVQPVNAPQQTPEEYYAEHADEVFDKEKAPSIMAKYNKMLMEREYGPMFNAQAAALVTTKKELLASRDEQFKRYEAEVEQLVRSQPANVQLNPNIYDQAWEVVRGKHRAELEEEAVNAKVAAAVEAKLKELGIDPTKPAAEQRPAAYANSASRPGGSGPSATKRTVRVPDQKTKQQLEAHALKRGLDIEDVLRQKGYM